MRDFLDVIINNHLEEAKNIISQQDFNVNLQNEEAYTAFIFLSKNEHS